MRQFRKLFEPGMIGNVEIKNRIVMAPMSVRFTGADGGITDRELNYYVARARGGAGLIITGSAIPHRGGHPGRLSLYDDKFIPGFKRLTEAVHKAGAKIFIQLDPSRGRVDETEPVAASNLQVTWGFKSRALSVAGIEDLLEQFGEGARRAREAGADGISIDGSGTYLIMDFLSPMTNKRTDKYGGSVEKRAQFAVEVVEAAKKKTGADFPLIFKYTADEKITDGLMVADSLIIGRRLQEAGADAIDILSGSASTFEWMLAGPCLSHGFNVCLAGMVKQAVNIPVMVSGRMDDPYLAEQALEEGKVDLIGIGRGLIADPEFAHKTESLRIGDIRPCVACNNCIDDLLVRRISVSCTVNPFVGREVEMEPGNAKMAKRVLVVGAGPGGMEAASVAAQRGHAVTLWEKSNRLGGQLNLAQVPPHKDEIKNLMSYLVSQTEKSGVEVQTRTEATVPSVLEFNPDVVIVATGAHPFIPEIAGLVENRNKVVVAQDVLEGKASVGDEVLIVGGELVGCETADYLTDMGKRVTLTTMESQLATNLAKQNRVLLLRRLFQQKGVIALSGVKYKALTPQGMIIVTDAGEEKTFNADTVVLATGSIPNNELVRELEGKVPELYAIGDCVKARNIFEAIHEGAATAVKI